MQLSKNKLLFVVKLLSVLFHGLGGNSAVACDTPNVLLGFSWQSSTKVPFLIFLSCRKRIGAGAFIGLLLAGGLAGILGWFFTREQDRKDMTGKTFHNETVATDNKECSDVGEDILDQNGSAVDAAIAAMFCLGVINMHSSGIGGGGVMLVYNRKHGEANVLDFRETAPASVTEFEGQLSEDDKSKVGGLSIAVPGEVHGTYKAWREYGRLPWKDLLQPAIDLARNGFPISVALGEVLKDEKTIEYIEKDYGLRELLIDKNGKPYKANKKITNKKYANTLEEIQEDPETFYNGPLADKIVEDMTRVKESNRLDEGKVTREDLRKYQTVTREPLRGNLSGMTMYLTPPPTSGAVLALILNILKGYHLTSSDRDGLSASILTYHRIIEAFKFAYAWRSRLGDPLFNPEKEINKIAQQMLEEKLGNKLRSKINDDRTHDDVSYYAQFYSRADIGTTHISVLAKNGDAVSVTTTINYWFGSKFRSNVTGIIYNNQMADFDLRGHDIVGGISPSEVNFPEPEKRPFSSISPAILTDDKGQVRFVIGASGGKKITTAVSLVLMNTLWFDKSLFDAVDEPRVHNELVPDQNVDIEKEKKYRLDSKIVKGLEDRGHEVRSERSFAVVQAVYREAKNIIRAKSDPRKHGEPAGQ